MTNNKKIRRTNLDVGRSPSVEAGGDDYILVVHGRTANGREHEFRVQVNDYALVFLARSIKGVFEKQALIEADHRRWRERPFTDGMGPKP